MPIMSLDSCETKQTSTSGMVILLAMRYRTMDFAFTSRHVSIYSIPLWICKTFHSETRRLHWNNAILFMLFSFWGAGLSPPSSHLSPIGGVRRLSYPKTETHCLFSIFWKYEAQKTENTLPSSILLQRKEPIHWKNNVFYIISDVGRPWATVIATQPFY